MSGSLRLWDCALRVIQEGHPVTARTLGRRLGADQFATEEVLRHLERAGVVFGKGGPSDRRPRLYRVYRIVRIL